ncbi:hypothetical protein COX86_00440 [Candidatus Micrarchaeota archaeon CG_4_10_14_0_2_um_filter_60_11]|nr:MAG: hypothetical protein AUJ16_00820 [Candidatus Micrarchaeota archaeon CG1_02_60_51]PIN96076.1 MAG: hypothetical protein COU39_02650 [Candidatus Micrarchaeota archaeon CG10_big_fil_rev_8_21_14_0_10_60_32]PIO01582.1 MAG: hypothetical protein COT58_04270 [Candidatus Micrarchaeota archaeon CG09_land_8_20_14_0_10_60_16]PIY91711.1 MAG: hypothetical protein COY71_01565 [Candidatus Micrarchaeota archaeon CG_4_10_14_0_8_um_filter_60_7]PIZ91292.1 MAG: hypothetical protein COX86_00440 [Candidatus Mi
MPQNKKKIVFLTYGLVNSSSDGRVTSAKYFAESLAKKADVTFLSTGPKRRSYAESGVRYEVVKTGDGFGFLRSLGKLRAIIRAGKPDFVEYHPPAGFNFLNIAYLCILSLFHKLESVPFGIYLWGGPRQVLRWGKPFNKIITPTREDGAEWVPPAVDLSKFNPARRDRAAFGMGAKKTVLFMTGAKDFSPEVFDYLLRVRGLADFAAAAKKLPGLDFVVAVPCLEKGEGRRVFERYLKSGARPANIRLIGEADAPKLLASADAFVFPYQKEEPLFAPVSIIESFASGTPVIAGDLAFVRKIISDGKTGLLYAVGNPDSLAKRVLRACEKGASAALRSNALAEAKKYSAKNSADRLLAAMAK